MDTNSPSSITIDGVTLTLIVERKQVKNINARLRKQTLYISAPRKIAQSTLDKAIPELARKLLRRVHARTLNKNEDLLAISQEIAKRFPQAPQIEQIQFVTNQEARWGSYSAHTRSIRLNAALRSMPRWVLESVIAHELAHAFHLDHSPAFWALLRSVWPDTDRAQAFLSGVAWLGASWNELPEIERAILLGSEPGEEFD
jgi:predicted metal-dependent hydrolase